MVSSFRRKRIPLLNIFSILLNIFSTPLVSNNDPPAIASCIVRDPNPILPYRRASAIATLPHPTPNATPTLPYPTPSPAGIHFDPNPNPDLA